MANIPAISRVSVKILDDALIEYKVVYSETENAVLIYDKLNDKATLLSYNVNGENVLKVINQTLVEKSKFRDEKVLFNFLIENHPELAHARIEHISFDSKLSYELYVVSHEGTYIAVIDDVDGEIQLKSF